MKIAKFKSWKIVSILHNLQKKEGYLSENALKQLAKKININLAQIYGIATFYKSFNLVPQGEHTVTLCLGTACHVRGGERILNEITNFLGIKPGETTPDRFFTLKVVNCVGACAIGPVMIIDGKYYGHMSAIKAKKILIEYKKYKYEKKHIKK